MKHKCTKCKIEKDPSNFYWRDKNKKILTSYCKECNKSGTKRWRKEEGKEKWLQSRNKKVEKVREWVNQEKAKGCERCGDPRFYVIDFHHISTETKKYTIGSQGHYSSWKSTKEEISKCIRLCANCHRELHYLEKINKNDKK